MEQLGQCNVRSSKFYRYIYTLELHSHDHNKIVYNILQTFIFSILTDHNKLDKTNELVTSIRYKTQISRHIRIV